MSGEGVDIYKVIKNAISDIVDKAKEDCYVVITLRTTMGLSGLERAIEGVLENLGLTIARYERVWSANSITGALGYYLHNERFKGVIVNFILSDGDTLVSTSCTPTDPMDEAYEHMGDEVSSSIFRIFSDKMG